MHPELLIPSIPTAAADLKGFLYTALGCFRTVRRHSLPAAAMKAGIIKPASIFLSNSVRFHN
jgi:hypothetical protein